MASAETARLIASLELQDKNFTRGLKNVERGISKVDRRLGAVSGAVNRNLARGIDTVISKGSEFLVGTVKDATDFETAITGVAKTVTGDISGVTDELKKLSTEIPLSFVELAGVAELGGAMGIAKKDLVAFTKQVAIIGTTTDVSVEDAATALGQLQNIIGLTGDEFDNFAASLVDLGNKGASTESAILEIAKRSGGAAKLFGIAKDETLGWAAATANLALGQELGGTALQNLFIKSLPKFIQGSKTLRDVTGKTNKELKRSWKKDASGALQDFIGDLSKLSKGERLAAIQKLYGKGSGLTRLLVGLSDDQKNLTDSLEVGSKAWKEATAAQEEAEKRFKTSESLFKRLDNSVKIVSATIGEALLPVLNDLATEAIDFLNKPGTQKGIKNFATSIGKGVRSLAKIVTAINWGAVAGFLKTAAGFAGQLVTWFGKMPDWAQAFLIGGFAVTKLPVIGDLFSSLASGLIKGVLGMNAGVVNINAGVVNGGGGPLGAGGSLFGKGGIGKLLIGFTGVGLLALLASEFEDEVEGLANTLGQGWRDWLKTSFHIDVPTLKIPELEDLQWPFGPKNTPTILPEIFGGNGVLGGTPATPTRLGGDRPSPGNPGLVRQGLANASPHGGLRGGPPVKVTVTNQPKPKPQLPNRAQIEELSNVKKAVAPLPAGLRTAEAAINNVKKAVAPLPAGLRAAEAEIGNVKTATTTLNTTAATGLTNVNTTALAGNTAAAFHSAANVIATGSTTTAVNTNAAATRLVAPSINPAIYAIGASISAAIWASGAANKPVIQSTNVVNNYTTRQRTGATSGSRNSNPLATHRG